MNKRQIIVILFTFMLVLSLFPSVWGAWGDISNADDTPTDEWEFDGTNGEFVNILKVYSQTYAIAYESTEADGVVFTLQISDAGIITESQNDTLTFESGTATEIDMIHVQDDVYIVSYQDGSGGNIKSFTISNTGDISAVLDTLAFDTSTCVHSELIHVGGDVCAVAYEGVDEDGFLKTFTVSDTGAISDTVTDTLEFDITECYNPRILHVKDDYYAITYTSTATSGETKTVDINSDGTIENSVIDDYTWDSSNGDEPDFIKLSDGYFAVVYAGSGVDGYVATFTIGDTGDLPTSSIDSWEYEESNGERPCIYYCGGTVYAIAFEGVGGDGFIKTLNISDTGSITKTLIDTCEYDTLTGQFPDIVHLDGDYYAIVYTGPATDGWIATLNIESGPFPQPPVPEPDAPSSFTATAISSSRIDLSWTKGNGGDYTYIEWNTVESWGIGEGTLAYNNTGTSYSHTDLDAETTYYYQAWSYNSTSGFSLTNVSANATTEAITDPTTFSNPYPANGSINISFPFVLSIDVNNSNNDSMNVSFWTNATGPWTEIGNYTGIYNGTYTAQENEFKEYNTKYWWSVNVNYPGGWSNITYSFTTGPAPNSLPYKEVYPPTFMVEVPIPIRLRAIVEDKEDDTMNFYWYTNYSGSWELIGTNLSVSDGTYYQDFPYSVGGTKYYWSLNISNDEHWTNETFVFQSEFIPGINWYDGNWSYSMSLTINHTLIDENLTYFPWLFKVNNSDFQYAQEKGQDFIVVADDNYTVCPHEFEYFDNSTNELLFWVNVPLIREDNDTTVWLYWGNPVCPSQEDVEGTWNEDFIMVHHYKDNSLLDSTSNNNDGTDYGTAYESNGLIYGCREGFDHNDSGLRVNNFVGPTSQFLAEMWVYIDPTNAENQPMLFSEGPWNFWLNDWASYLRLTNDEIRVRVGGSTAGEGGTIPGSNEGYWIYVATRIDTSAQGDYVDSYFNTTQAFSTAFTQGIPDNYDYLWIGRNDDLFGGNKNWDGYFDEVRLSNSTRSRAWTNATYRNIMGIYNGTEYGVDEGDTNVLSLNISVSPNEINFGTVNISESAQTNNYYLNLTNHGATCLVTISIGNTQNWTFVNYTDLGHDAFAVNISEDNWTSEDNVKTTNDTELVDNLAYLDYQLFDIKAILPTSISGLSDGESCTVTFTATAT